MNVRSKIKYEICFFKIYQYNICSHFHVIFLTHDINVAKVHLKHKIENIFS